MSASIHCKSNSAIIEQDKARYLVCAVTGFVQFILLVNEQENVHAITEQIRSKKQKYKIQKVQ